MKARDNEATSSPYWNMDVCGHIAAGTLGYFLRLLGRIFHEQECFAAGPASVLALSVQAALAQDKPAPPPAWHQGKTPAMADSKLAPNPGRNTETPASDIPISKLKLPKGFKAEVWATGLVGARAMTLNDDQTKMWVGTRGMGRVYEVTNEGDKRTVKVMAEKLTQPTAVYANGALYVFAIDKVLRYDNAAKGAAGQPVDMTAAFELPKEQHHNWKYVRLGADKKLYVPFGAAVQHLRAANQGVTRRSAATTWTARAWR